MKILCGLLLCVIALSTPLSLLADTNSSFHWEYINVDINVKNNGDLLVTETQKYVFKKAYNKQRYRWIPLNKVASIEDITVTENNKLLPIEVIKKDNKIRIQWQHSLTPPESHIFVLKYRVTGAIQTSNGVDRIYWKAIFKDRTSNINHSRVTVHLAKKLADKIIEMTGYGIPSHIRKENQQEQTSIQFIADRHLLPKEELEVLISLPHGLLDLKPEKDLVPESKKKPTSFFKWVSLEYFLGMSAIISMLLIIPVSLILPNGTFKHLITNFLVLYPWIAILLFFALTSAVGAFFVICILALLASGGSGGGDGGGGG